jgi:hypothetical protein
MTQDITPEAVAKVLEGVTPGPWAYNTHREVGPLHTGDDQAYGMICDAVCEVNFDADHLGNARFIAWAREAVPAIAAERDEWKARAEAAEAEVARLERWQTAAFIAHGNLDLDIEANPEARAAILAMKETARIAAMIEQEGEG